VESVVGREQCNIVVLSCEIIVRKKKKDVGTIEKNGKNGNVLELTQLKARMTSTLR